MKIIIYTGDAGTGISTAAAVEAHRSAKAGVETLFISNNPEWRFSDKPVKTSNCLDVMALKDTSEYREWTVILSWLIRVMNWDHLCNVSVDEVEIVPKIKAVVNLLGVLNYADQKRYDRIIIDADISMEMFRLFSYPELIAYWEERLFQKGRYLYKAVKPFARLFTSVELPDEAVEQAGQILLEQLFKLQKLFLNRDVTSVRLVMGPYEQSLKNSERDYMYLCMFGFNSDMLIINRLLPAESAHGYFSSRYHLEQNLIKKAELNLNPVPVGTIRIFQSAENNFLGLEKELKAAQFPDEVVVEPVKITHFQITAQLPSDWTSPEVFIKDDSIIIKSGSLIKRMYLPHVFRSRTVNEAQCSGQKLIISFS